MNAGAVGGHVMMRGTGRGGRGMGGRECGGMEKDVRKIYEINELYKRRGVG